MKGGEEAEERKGGPGAGIPAKAEPAQHVQPTRVPDARIGVAEPSWLGARSAGRDRGNSLAPQRPEAVFGPEEAGERVVASQSPIGAAFGCSGHLFPSSRREG